MAPAGERLAAEAKSGPAAEEFFIAGRLRGIPLVSMSKSWQASASPAKRVEGAPGVALWPQTTSERPPQQVGAMAAPKWAGQPRASQVGKRDARASPSGAALADTHGRRIQSQAEVLFRQTGSTSAMAKLVKSTTTKRPSASPRAASGTTTTRRPPVITTKRLTTTTTTRRPSGAALRRQQKQLAKATRDSDQRLAGPANETSTSTNTSASTTAGGLILEPISSHKMSTLEAMSATVGSFVASTLPLLPGTAPASTTSLPPAMQATAAAAAAAAAATSSTTTTGAGTTSAERPGQSFQQHATTLTRAMQTLSTLPVSQRRTQPNLVPARGGSTSTRLASDSRNGYAGEHWHLFKRPDGDLSAFETLVLLANILIVSTIILVLLINWIRVFKKRRGPASGAMPVATVSGGQAATTPVGAEQPPASSLGEVAGDRASKMSLISSGVSQTTSAPDTHTTATTTSSAAAAAAAATTAVPANLQQPMRQPQQPQPQQQQPKVPPERQGAEHSKTTGAGGETFADKGLPGVGQKIASEFSAASAHVANKAMAIVQPTENNSTRPAEDKQRLMRGLKDELLGGAQRTINRSVSDLSSGGGGGAGGGAATARAETDKRSADDMSTPAAAAATPDRVANLEELFSGTKREIERQKEDEATRRMQVKQERQKQQQQQDANGSRGAVGPSKDEPRRVHSSSSLESIELPNNLVESIKRAAPSTLRPQVDETLGPSSNLLLGEVETKQELPATSEPEATKTKPGLPDETAGAAAREQSGADRPQNPMCRDVNESGGAPPNSKGPEKAPVQPPEGPNSALPAAMRPRQQKQQQQQQQQQQEQQQQGQQERTATREEATVPAEVKNHQVVVNKLDKRKTNLEIVDLRDESVTGKMRSAKRSGGKGATEPPGEPADNSAGWISMDGVAVVQPSGSTGPMSPATAAALHQQQQQLAQQQQQQQQSPTAREAAAAAAAGTTTAAMAANMSPSEIIESRFHVDYKSKRKAQTQGAQTAGQMKSSDSVDSKQEEYVFNNIESELELDNKMKNRKYFVYVVHDGHFTAKKECIARIELPPKRRITLAELRQLISSSQDISLLSLRRNRFKFVTETYRLLNENEDAAVLHQVYPTQGVFLKLNVNEPESQSYAFKGGRSARLSSGSGGGSAADAGAPGGSSSLAQTTIASRRRAANVRVGAPRRSGPADSTLPAIEVNQHGLSSGYGAGQRASSVGQRARVRGAGGGGAFARSKSSVQVGRSNRFSGGGGGGGGGGATGARGAGMRRGVSSSNVGQEPDEGLPSIGMSATRGGRKLNASSAPARRGANGRSSIVGAPRLTIGEAASDLGANMVAGAKKLFSSTFHR